MRRLISTFVALLLVGGAVASCSDADQESCNNLSGSGKYVPVEENGNVYCENPWNGDRFLLR